MKYVWYDGYKDAVFDPGSWKLVSKHDPSKPPQERNLPDEKILEGQGPDQEGDYGCVVIGSEGRLFFNRGKDNWFVKPSHMLDGLQVEQSIPRARGQDPHNEFFDAIVAGNPKGALSNFHHAGPFTEMVLLGNLAVRLGKKVEWDAANLRSPNSPEADPLIRRPYRKGWELEVEV